MVKRFFQVLVVFFAIYAFVFVPLGKKTALEHLRAIFGTPAAREAAEEVKGGVTRLVRRLQSEARQSTEKTDRRLREHDAEREAARASDDAEASGSGDLPRDLDVPREEKARHAGPAASDEARADEAATPRQAPKLRALSAKAPAPMQH